MGWGIISTWEMAHEGTKKGASILKNGGKAPEAVTEAIKEVENNPEYVSVGFGGLPNENGDVELDAGYMNGDTLSAGMTGAVKNIKNPVILAKNLSEERFNIFLTGKGAEKYAHEKGLEKRNMLTEKSENEYKRRVEDVSKKLLSPYEGHDTVGVVAVDNFSTVIAATSTSGLFMKKEGRLGDSPVIGSGFYADSDTGGAVATGLGEDLMKGCISYETVRLMKEGKTPQEAAEISVKNLDKKLTDKRGKSGDISVVCMNRYGEWGAFSNTREFKFVVCCEGKEPEIYKIEDYKVIKI